MTTTSIAKFNDSLDRWELQQGHQIKCENGFVYIDLPFQLAYAVSIHKAQGLEYDSVKVIIPQSNSEKITHGIFYTAITRAKKKLKIYWSAETMKEIVSGFATNESNGKSLEIVKAKLALTQ